MENKMNSNNSNKELPLTTPLLSKSQSHFQNPESETDANRFKQSLKELKGLRSQLYHAAEYCENAFLKTTQKKILLDNTKNYVCGVVVTVVDHLGTVSSKLEQRISGEDKILQTEQRIDCLKQRFLTCQQYALSLDLSSLFWSTKVPWHPRCYVSPCAQPNFEDNIIIKPPVTNLAAGNKVTTVKPAFDSPSSRPKLLDVTTVMPAFESPSKPLKPFDFSFVGSLGQDAFKLGSSDEKKKPLQGSKFLPFLRNSKRKTDKSIRRMTF